MTMMRLKSRNSSPPTTLGIFTMSLPTDTKTSPLVTSVCVNTHLTQRSKTLFVTEVANETTGVVKVVLV